jgi:hypothetical protein
MMGRGLVLRGRVGAVLLAWMAALPLAGQPAVDAGSWWEIPYPSTFDAGELEMTLSPLRVEGTPREPSFALVSDAYLDVDVGRRAAPALVDLDGDGDLDLVVGSETEGLVVFRNEGGTEAADFRAVPSGFPAGLPTNAVPALGDIDGNGTLELFVGGAGGGVMYFESEGAGTAP